MPEQAGEKSQEATPHRRQQAREKGQVAQSQDLGSAALLVVAVLLLMLLGPAVAALFGELLSRNLGGEAWLTADLDFLLGQWNWLLTKLAGTLLPILGLLMLAGIAVNLGQVGFLYVPDRLAPDVSRISVLRGAQRMFSLTSAVRFSFGLFKVIVVAAVAFVSLYTKQNELVALSGLEVGQIAAYTSELVLWTCLKVGAALLILAILDYAYQRWKHEQDIRMTPQEVREEMKNLQGDPQIIARRRAVQRQLIMNRMSDAVPKADVVVTNPTELAVAIRYEPDEMAAPIVVAKGAGTAAARIRRIALEHNIPIVEKKPLAQQLYREVEINQPVPSETFAAVAEILAYVYQLKGKEVPAPPSS